MPLDILGFLYHPFCKNDINPLTPLIATNQSVLEHLQRIVSAVVAGGGGNDLWGTSGSRIPLTVQVIVV